MDKPMDKPLLVKCDGGTCCIMSKCQPETQNQIVIGSLIITMTKTFIKISFTVAKTEQSEGNGVTVTCPDLNPVETLWTDLKKKAICARKPTNH